jgi:hypothetical protein
VAVELVVVVVLRVEEEEVQVEDRLVVVVEAADVGADSLTMDHPQKSLVIIFLAIFICLR